MKYLVLVFALVLSSCTGALNGDESPEATTPDLSDERDFGTPSPDMRDTPPPDDMGNTSRPDTTNAPDVGEEPFEPGACEGSTLGDDFSLVPLAGTQSAGAIQATPTENGGAIVAWRDAGDVVLTHVDGSGQEVAEMRTQGTEIYGVAAHAGGRAVLVSRGSDILALVIFDQNTSPVSDQIVIGDVDHSVTNNEWFGAQLRSGRLIWTGTRWAAYYTVQRLWDDGVAHYGDQLRLYEPDGSSFSMVWGWGCSHSMDVRISHNGDGLGAVCSSDCYPAKGVHFNHRGGMLWPDESGSDCRGGYGTSVGASIPINGGFWVAFTAIDDRDSSDVAILEIEGRNLGSPVWLTADAVRDTALNATKFKDDLVVAWNSDATNQFVVASGADGSTIEGPVEIPTARLAGSSDFFNFANGDVGWVQPGESGQIELARLRVCE